MQAVDNVLHAAGLFVDEILALPAAEQSPRKRDFVVFEVGKHLRRVVKRERDFTKRLTFALLRTAENDVLHVRTAHRLCRLFAEHPADGVRHVALAAAVRPYNTGDPVIEFDFGFVRKGLETVEFDFFEIQSSILPFSDAQAILLPPPSPRRARFCPYRMRPFLLPSPVP